MNLQWTLNRLRRMEFGEVTYRARQAAKAVAERAGLGRAVESAAIHDADSSPWHTPLPREFDRALYAGAADTILAGNYNIFSMTDAHLGFPPAWNRDPKTGTVAPLAFGKTLDYRDERLVGNIKYLWEPNRHLELVTLAQAWHLTGEQAYAEGVRTALHSWFAQCPYLRGPNWTSSLELGIRLVNWSIAWHLLGGHASGLFAGPEGREFKGRWLTSIYQHCHFIDGHFSRYSSANNHLLGELLGLFVASTTWPAWSESARWRDRAREEFEAEALRQNTVDGVNREQGIWYHHEVLDMMLLALLVGRANGIGFSEQFTARIEAMLEFIASVMDYGGRVPAWGDSDDATIVHFCPAGRFDPFKSLLCTGAVLFNRGDFKFKAGSIDDKTRWLLGDEAEVGYAVIRAFRSDRVRRDFPDGGYVVLGSELDTPAEVRIVLDAGPLGYLALAAHGHADALSFTLSAGGKELLIDPGTFSYHTDRGWRDYFRGTSAHNTVRVDGLDQSVAGGSFLWMRHARARCEAKALVTGNQHVRASHDGYLRLSDPVLHRRELTYDASQGVLLVDDRLECRGEHSIEIFWHFSEDCRVELRSDRALVENDGAKLVLQWSADCFAELVKGRESPPLGWISRRFDSKEPCSTIVARRRITGSWEGRSELRISLPDAPIARG